MAIINRETDYAVRVLSRLGSADDLLSVSVLAQNEKVPEVFLRKIMQRLHRAGIVASRQGPFGGYELARPAREISFHDVIVAVQGPLIMNECFAEPGACERVPACPVRAHLAVMQDDFNARLSGITLAEIILTATAAKGAPK